MGVALVRPDEPGDRGSWRFLACQSAETSMNIGDNSLPEKLALVSPDGPNTENPLKTGCLA
jgi:hypothetical protein